MDGIMGVDYVSGYEEVTREENIKMLKFLKPDIVAVKKQGKDKIEAYSGHGWEVIEIPEDEPYSTTEIIKRCRN